VLELVNGEGLCKLCDPQEPKSVDNLRKHFKLFHLLTFKSNGDAQPAGNGASLSTIVVAKDSLPDAIKNLFNFTTNPYKASK